MGKDKSACTIDATHLPRDKMKKNKKIKIVANPFLGPSNALNHRQSTLPARPFHMNSFSESRVLFNLKSTRKHETDNDDGNDNSSEDNDEERVIQARRGALAVLDPTNKDSGTEKFKALRINSYQNTNTIPNQQSAPYQPPSLHHEQQLFGLEHDQDLVSISTYTPPSPVYPEHHIEDRGYWSTMSQSTQKPNLVSSHLPAPSVISASEPSQDCDQYSTGVTVAPSCRSYLLYMELSQRKTSQTSKIDIGIDIESNNGIVDHANTMMERDLRGLSHASYIWSLKRNTFVTSAGQGNGRQRQRTSRSTLRTKRQGLDPWESDNDMLIYGTDDDDDGTASIFRQGALSLKGKVGGRRRSEDGDAALIHREQAGFMRLTESRTEDWMIHPRTAAIRGTFRKAYADIVPVPGEAQRPVSLGGDFTSLSLASSPVSDSVSRESLKSTGLLRTGSLDSSFFRLKRSTTTPLSALPMMFEFVSSQREDSSQSKKLAEETMLRMVDGCVRDNTSAHDPVVGQDERPNCRSSATTFGLYRSPSSPSLAIPLSFSSFQGLISSAVAGLSRSASVPRNVHSPSFLPTAYVRRSKTTGYDGYAHGLCEASFSPGSRRRDTPVMIPTIVIPQPPMDEQAGLSATTVTFCPSLVSSSLTLMTSHEQEAAIFGDCGDESDEEFLMYTLHPIRSSAYQQQQQYEQLGEVLKAPPPTMSFYGNQGSALAMSAMVDTQHVRDIAGSNALLNRSTTTMSTDSLMGPLRGTDYIGQFERERAQARYDGAFRFREGGMPSLSTASLAMAVCHGTPSSSMSALQRKAGVKSVDTLDRWRGSGNEEKGLREAREQHQLEPCGLMSRLTSSNLFGLEFLRRHGRQSSSQSDISEKLMHLPEPSRFEGVCSCRGVVNITSMLLIMCGLVLLVLGYPIATSLKKQRLAEEEANGMRAEMGQVKFTMANSTLMSGGEGGSVGGAMTTATAYVEGV